jgi:hypothetical protein
MRRVLTVLALVLAMAGLSAPAYATSTDSGARHWRHHHAASAPMLVIERVAPPIRQYSPFVEPEPTFPLVTVVANLRGCEPGRLYVASTRLFQHRREITGIAGGRGFGEFACGADGTARISQSKFDQESLVHPGRLRASMEVVAFDGGPALASATARVRIPRW